MPLASSSCLLWLQPASCGLCWSCATSCGIRRCPATSAGLLLPPAGSACHLQAPPASCSLDRLRLASIDKVKCSTRRSQGRGAWSTKCSSCSFIGVNIPPAIELSASDSTVISVPYSAHEVAQFLKVNVPEMSQAASVLIKRLVLVDLDPATAKLAISFLGPFLSAFGFLFILRIVMSWYPKLPVEKFPYVIAYAPTEPLLFPTRKLIPPLGGVDVTPVVWFGLISFLNEILVGPQGLLVLLSQQV